MKADPRDPVILSDDQYERLLGACADRPMLSLYVLLLGETGARCGSEGLRVRWEDVDFERGFLRIASGRDGHRTKSGKRRWVPMTLRLKQAMRGTLHGSDSRCTTAARLNGSSTTNIRGGRP